MTHLPMDQLWGKRTVTSVQEHLLKLQSKTLIISPLLVKVSIFDTKNCSDQSWKVTCLVGESADSEAS